MSEYSQPHFYAVKNRNIELEISFVESYMQIRFRNKRKWIEKIHKLQIIN